MYSIIELQTNEGVTAHIYQTAETLDDAMSKYHGVLSFAAISTLDYHACIVLDAEGNTIARESFTHLKGIEA